MRAQAQGAKIAAVVTARDAATSRPPQPNNSRLPSLDRDDQVKGVAKTASREGKICPPPCPSLPAGSGQELTTHGYPRGSPEALHARRSTAISLGSIEPYQPSKVPRYRATPGLQMRRSGW